ncbi:MAG TPA: ferritin-like domain-containing protein [Gaiellaceae bacterium]
MDALITRAQLLSRSAKGGAALAVAGVALGQFVDAASADPLPTGDLAYARLLVGAELLASDFYTQAIAAANTSPAVTKYLKIAHSNEQEHYQSVAGILKGAGVTPAVSGDIDFTYPKGSFDSEKSILGLAQTLETTVLGTYLGAIGGIQTNSFKQGIAQIASSEAQHLSYFTSVMGGRAFSLAFPVALPIDQASNAMDAYTS